MFWGPNLFQLAPNDNLSRITLMKRRLDIQYILNAIMQLYSPLNFHSWQVMVWNRMGQCATPGRREEQPDDDKNKNEADNIHGR